MIFFCLYTYPQTLTLPTTFDLYKVKYSYLVHIFLRSKTVRRHQRLSLCDFDAMIPQCVLGGYIWQATAVEAKHIKSFTVFITETEF